MKTIFLIISIAVPVGIIIWGVYSMVKLLKEIMRDDPWGDTHEDL